MDWSELGTRIFIAGITLLAVCSSLIGVITGWWLRGREVRELKTKLEHIREDFKGYTRVMESREQMRRRSGEN
jgi:hypothetical protein